MELLARIQIFARSTPNAIAYLDAATGRSIRYGEFAQAIDSSAQSLRAEFPNARALLLYANNTLAFASWFLACMAARRDVLLVNQTATPIELDALTERVDADAIIYTPAEPDRRAIRPRETCEHRSTSSSPSASLLLATSGSTGTPKIVRRTADSLDAVAANMVEAIGFTRDDRVLAAVPLTHSYGIEHGLLAPLWAGATVVLCDGLDLPNMTAAFARGITIFPAVPSMIERLADVGEPVAGIADVRRIYSAGGPLPDAVRDRFAMRYGVEVGQLYGSTEVGTVTYRPGNATEPGDVGRPLRDVSIRILDVDDNARRATLDAVGDVAIRSPSMLAGYLESGDDARPDLVDGHFLTGDLGRLAADGSLLLTGRSRLLIDTGGLKVNPMEVEAVIASHPQVAACVVVSLPQSETVSRLRAIVVARSPNAPPSADEIRAFARDRLASYKVPRVVEFRAKLPRSATGKILRHMLDD